MVNEKYNKKKNTIHCSAEPIVKSRDYPLFEFPYRFNEFACPTRSQYPFLVHRFARLQYKIYNTIPVKNQKKIYLKIGINFHFRSMSSPEQSPHYSRYYYRTVERKKYFRLSGYNRSGRIL